MIKYAITDPNYFDLDNADEYFANLDADMVLFRDKQSSNYTKDAAKFLYHSKSYNFKKILHQDYELAYGLNCDGVHLTSKQLVDIKSAKKLNLFTIVSTHSIEEIFKAKLLGADAVTFSPIFATPNKAEPKGIDKLKKAINCCDIKVIALGGIVTQNEVNLIKQTKAWGFASIRYFIKTTI